MSDQIPLTEKQKQSLRSVVDGESYSGAPMLISRPNPHLRVFVAAFDGTRNDRDAIPKGERPSLVAEFQHDLSLKKTDKVHSEYYEGVATRTNALNEMVEGGLGTGSLERAERAYKDFSKQVETWRAEDPKVEVHVHVMSFSRGGGSALHFLNMVDKEGGLPAPGSKFAGMEVPTALRPGHIESSATLLDSVVTGQRETLNLQLPPSTVSVLQVTADLEERRAFAFTDSRDPGGGDYIKVTGVGYKVDGHWDMNQNADNVIHVAAKPTFEDVTPDTPMMFPRVATIHVPGVHSDIGGTYGEGGIREVSKYLVDRYQRDLGFDVVAHKPTDAQIDAAFAHESRWAIDKGVDFLLGENKRVHHEGKLGDWDGKVDFNLTVKEGEYTKFTSEAGKPKQGLSLPADGFSEHTAHVTLSPKGDLKFQGAGSKAFGYDAAADRVTFHGQALEFFGTKEALAHTIAQNGGSTEISVEARKALPELAIGDNSPATPASNVQYVGGETFKSPEAALGDILTEGLRRIKVPEQHLSDGDLRTVVQALQTAPPNSVLVLSGDSVSLDTAHVSKPGEVAFDVDSLRAALPREQSMDKAPSSDIVAAAPVREPQLAMER